MKTPDISFCESVGLTPLNWRKELEGAVARDEGLSSELVMMAGNWDTCAVGCQSKRIKRVGANPNNRPPLDEQLIFLGQKFWNSVYYGNYPEALLLLDQIEARTQVLLLALDGVESVTVTEDKPQPMPGQSGFPTQTQLQQLTAYMEQALAVRPYQGPITVTVSCD